jgi:hypothetical protein
MDVRRNVNRKPRRGNLDDGALFVEVIQLNHEVRKTNVLVVFGHEVRYVRQIDHIERTYVVRVAHVINAIVLVPVLHNGADVNASDYSAFSNIVLIKNFRSKEDLRAVLTEDLSNAEELVVRVDDFFDVWVESLDVEQSMREKIVDVRRRVLNKIVK